MKVPARKVKKFLIPNNKHIVFLSPWERFMNLGEAVIGLLIVA
jgi:hypothetical protein